MASLKSCRLWRGSFGLTKSFFSVRFLAMASLQILSALARLIWLNEIVEFYLRVVCTLTRGVVL